MIILLLILNLAISIFNAIICGRTWNETKYQGGLAHFMNWCGAIMSACGFTNVYAVIIGLIASSISTCDNGVCSTLISQKQFDNLLSLQYLLIVFPVIGSGIVITIQSWKIFWERKNLLNGSIAAWDTFATVYNISNAIRYVPEASQNVSSLFDSDDVDKDSIVIYLVLFALLAGCLSTYWIIKSVSKSVVREKCFQYNMR